jgi:hypothetical protein
VFFPRPTSRENNPLPDSPPLPVKGRLPEAVLSAIVGGFVGFCTAFLVWFGPGLVGESTIAFWWMWVGWVPALIAGVAVWFYVTRRLFQKLASLNQPR